MVPTEARRASSSSQPGVEPRGTGRESRVPGRGASMLKRRALRSHDEVPVQGTEKGFDIHPGAPSRATVRPGNRG